MPSTLLVVILGVQFLRMVIRPRIYEYVRYSVSLTISLMCFIARNDDVLKEKLLQDLDLQFERLKCISRGHFSCTDEAGGSSH